MHDMLLFSFIFLGGKSSRRVSKSRLFGDSSCSAQSFLISCDSCGALAFTFFAAFLTSLSQLVFGGIFPDAGEVLKLRLENSNTVEDAVKGIMRAVPFLPNPSEDEADATGEADESTEDDPFGSQEALVDLFVQYAKCGKRTMGVVQREEELLQELLERTKKERLRIQYMGARPAVKHQTASRNLNYAASARLNA